MAWTQRPEVRENDTVPSSFEDRSVDENPQPLLLLPAVQTTRGTPRADGLHPTSLPLPAHLEADPSLLDQVARSALLGGDLERARFLYAGWLSATAQGVDGKAEALAGLAEVHEALGDFEDAEHLARIALGLPDGPSCGWRAQLQMVMARIAGARGDLIAAQELLAKVPETHRLQALETAILILLDWGEISKALSVHEELSKSSCAHGATPSLATTRLLAAKGELCLARREALRLASSGRRLDEGWSLLLLAQIASNAGDLTSARTLARSAAVRGRAASARHLISMARLAMAQIALRGERLESARRLAIASLSIARRTGHRGVQMQARLLLAQVYARRGEVEAAMHQADAAVLVGLPGRTSLLRLEALLTTMDLAHLCGHLHRADSLWPEISAAIKHLSREGRLPIRLAVLRAHIEHHRGNSRPACDLLNPLSQPSAQVEKAFLPELVGLAIRLGRHDSALGLLRQCSDRFQSSSRGQLLEAIALRGTGYSGQALRRLLGVSRRPVYPLIVHRIRELSLMDLNRPGDAREEREAWLAIARCAPAASLGELRAHGLVGQKSLVLTTPSGRIRLSPEEADLHSSRAELDLIVDGTHRKAHLPSRRWVSFEKHPVLFDALKVLTQGIGRFLSKKEFYERLWQTDYDAEIHDQKIVKTLQRLRTMLGQGADGKPLLRMGASTGIGLPSGLSTGILQGDRDAVRDSLTVRQRTILNTLTANCALPAVELERACRACHTAILSDLATLIRLNLVVRNGTTRATRYCLASNDRRASRGKKKTTRRRLVPQLSSCEAERATRPSV